MTIRLKVLIPGKIIETADTVQYSAVGVVASIDKFTATNFGATNAKITLHLVASAGSISNATMIVKTKTLQPYETYMFPEIVGHILNSGDYIVTECDTMNSINVRCSGREVS
jgi:hypothetical protein